MNLNNRKYVIIIIMALTVIVFLFRLLQLQVIDGTWKAKAAEMTERKVTIYPSRGLIYDRKGKLLVSNKAVYDLMILPREVKDLDTTAFLNLLNITLDEFFERWKRATSWPNASYRPSVFIKQIPPEEFALITEQLYKFKGFYGQPRTLRDYPMGIGAHVLGDIGEINANELEKDKYYKSGDYIGKSGIEKVYEEELRGKRGSRFVLVDVLNNTKGSFADGEYDTVAVAGVDLYSSLDADLQAYAEKLMQNKRGSVVAIEPKTGEILTLVSSPTYDPNLLVGRNRGANYEVLRKDSLVPLFNRAIKGTYRPGSIFKMVQALVALESDAIKPQTRFHCNRSLIGCHGPHSYDDLEGAIIHSCNPYFREVLKRMVQPGKISNRFEESSLGLDVWKDKIQKFGFGSDLGTDIPGAKTGNIPGSKYYDRIYGEKAWAFSTIYSISIGEGELLITPMQMANLATIIANRGYYISPHVVRGVGSKDNKPEKFREKHFTGVDPEHFTTVVNAMQKVVDQQGGTARRARIQGIEVCGKTGTVQNDPLPDHSVFMAFAPKDDPKIALSVYVENAGSGGTWAAPIASLLIEQYLNDSISNPAKEQRILEASFPIPTAP